MPSAVSLQNVHKTYDKVPVVNDLSFTIESREMFGLLASNGAGKFTTIRMLTTLTRPSSGQIEVAGYDVVRNRFFPDLAQANAYLDSLPDKTGIRVRPSNLEDIFVERTGRQLG